VSVKFCFEIPSDRQKNCKNHRGYFLQWPLHGAILWKKRIELLKLWGVKASLAVKFPTETKPEKGTEAD